jgi:hypothetical protein
MESIYTNCQFVTIFLSIIIAAYDCQFITSAKPKNRSLCKIMILSIQNSSETPIDFVREPDELMFKFFFRIYQKVWKKNDGKNSKLYLLWKFY